MSIKLSLIGLILAFLVTAPSPAAPPPATGPAGEPFRILFIGNSLTFFNDTPEVVAGLARSADPQRPVKVVSSVVGGATLKKHWDDGNALKLIQQGGWNVVVVQGYSLAWEDPDAFVRYGKLFDEAITKAGARTVLYQNFATKESLRALQPRINQSYARLASETGAAVAPAGMAFQAATAEDPALDLYFSATDHTHPNIKGTYLIACTLYATIFDKSPEGLPFRTIRDRATDKPAELSPEQAAHFQKLAWQTVQQSKTAAPATQPAGRP